MCACIYTSDSFDLFWGPGSLSPFLFSSLFRQILLLPFPLLFLCFFSSFIVLLFSSFRYLGRLLLQGVHNPGEGSRRLPKNYQPRLSENRLILRAEEIRLQEEIESKKRFISIYLLIFWSISKSQTNEKTEVYVWNWFSFSFRLRWWLWLLECAMKTLSQIENVRRGGRKEGGGSSCCLHWKWRQALSGSSRCQRYSNTKRLYKIKIGGDGEYWSGIRGGGWHHHDDIYLCNDVKCRRADSGHGRYCKWSGSHRRRLDRHPRSRPNRTHRRYSEEHTIRQMA